MKTKQTVCQSCGNADINGKMKKCPNCGAKLSKPIYKKWWFWIIIVLALAIIGGGSATSNEESNTSTGTGSSQEFTSELIEENTTKYTKVELQQMLDELEENALKAEKTYKNTYIEVTGKIANFDSSGSYITIEPINADEWNFKTVLCYIKNEDQLNYLLEKSTGDRVTIKGKIISVREVLGYSMNIDSIE